MLKKRIVVAVYECYKDGKLYMTGSRRKIMRELGAPEGMNLMTYQKRTYLKHYTFKKTNRTVVEEVTEIMADMKKPSKKEREGRKYEEVLDRLYRCMLPYPHTTCLNIHDDPEKYLADLEKKGLKVTYEKRPDICSGKRIGWFYVLKGEKC